MRFRLPTYNLLNVLPNAVGLLEHWLDRLEGQLDERFTPFVSHGFILLQRLCCPASSALLTLADEVFKPNLLPNFMIERAR